MGNEEQKTARRKVLVVEDYESIQRSIQRMLQFKGCEVFIAATWEQALEIFQKERPQACSMEALLCHTTYDSTFEFIKAIRKIDPLVYCVFLTKCTYDDEDIRKQARELKVDALFFKPFPRDKFKEMCDLFATGTHDDNNELYEG